MRVLKKNDNYVHDYPKQTKCDHCDAELEYELQDEHVGWMGCKYITCPECGKESSVNDIRTMEPNYPMTFHHFNADNGAKEIGDEKTRDYVNKVVEYLIEHKDAYATYVGAGNTMVFGFNNDRDGIEICVTKDYWEDFLDANDYYMIK